MRTIEFSEFKLDLDTSGLTKGTESIPIGKRCFDLLVHLIENREKYVSTDSLRNDVWKGAKLSAAAIPTCVRELRRILQDQASRPRIIDSKKGKGYRFIAHPIFANVRGRTLDIAVDELPLVGRTNELKALREIHRISASTKRSQLIAIRGEAGIGKSRLLDEFLRGSPPTTHRFIVNCKGSNPEAPFGHWIEILNQATESSVFANIKTPLAESIQLALEMKPNDSSLETPSKRRTQIFQKWTETIRGLSSHGPIIIAFDNIHLTDPDSIHLAAWVHEALCDYPLMIVTTHRPLPSSRSIEAGLEGLMIGERTAAIDISPLSRSDIDEILRPTFLHELVSPARLYSLTFGNPFLIGCALRNAEINRLKLNHFDISRLNDYTHSDIVARITSDLPQETKDLLTIGAVIGPTFSTTMLSALTALSAPTIQTRLEPARRARLLKEDAFLYQFSHAILRESLSATMPSPQRSDLHSKAALFLQTREDADFHICAIASHMKSAVPRITALEAISYCAMASEYSASQYAYFDAKQFAESAFDLSAQDPCITIQHRCRLQITLARRSRLLGDRESARGILLSVVDIARRENFCDLLIDCALALTEDFALIDFGVHDVILEHLLREAIHLTPHNQLALRSKLTARLSQVLQWSHQSEQQTTLARESQSLALECNNPDARREALCALSEALHGPEAAEERLHTLEALESISGNWRCADDVLLHQTRKITALLDMGLLDQIASENLAYWELASRTGQPHHIWYAMTTDSMRSLMRGDLELSEKLEANYRAISEISENPNVTQGYAAQRFFWEVECGRSREVLPALKEVCKRYPLVVGWEAALSWLHWDLDERIDAQRYLSHFTNERLSTMRRQAGSGASIAMLSEVAALLGKRPLQTSLYSLVEPLKKQCASAGYGVLYYGSYARYGGLLAGALGERKKAMEMLELAADHEASRGADLWLAYTLLDLASVVKRWGRSTGRAARLFDEASGIAKALRAPRLLRRLSQAEKEFS